MARCSVPTRSVLITCEHAGNHVPPPLRSLFGGSRAALASHRGWDPGALQLARRLAAALQAPLIAAAISRLVVDANRSRGHPDVLSWWTRGLDRAGRESVLRRYYDPYRSRVERELRRAIKSAPVLHIGVHTFTPVLRGVRRAADIGLLYDPGRPRERAVCRSWRRALLALDPDLRVRFNYPYRGTADGLTTAMRARLAPASYAGIEIEVNQRFPRAGGATWRGLQQVLCASLAAIRPPRAPAPRPRRGTGARRGRSPRA